MKILIQEDELIFSLTEPQDLEDIIIMERDKENSRYVYNWSKEEHISAIESSEWIHITIRKTTSLTEVGYILLRGINSEDEVIELTRIVINHKGMGYGRRSIRLIKKLCFEILGCHRLWLDVYDYNLRGIKLYESEGFIKEGTLRECKKKEERYYSMCIFSMLRGEYNNL